MFGTAKGQLWQCFQMLFIAQIISFEYNLLTDCLLALHIFFAVFPADRSLFLTDGLLVELFKISLSVNMGFRLHSDKCFLLVEMVNVSSFSGSS